MEEVFQTSQISFDSEFKTFRYLSQSSRMTHFNTTELWARDENYEGIAKVMFAETLDEIQETWRTCRGSKSRPGSTPASRSTSPGKYLANDTPGDLQISRLENACWRAMGMRLGSSEEVGLPENVLESKDSLSSSSERPNRYHRSMSDPPEHASLHSMPSVNPTPKLSPPAAEINRSRSGSVLSLENRLLARIHRQTEGSKHRAFDRKSGVIGKGELCVEYSDHGTGDFRSPSFSVTSSNGSSISPLRYKYHKIYRGKLSSPYPMPSIRSLSPYDASTLVVTTADVHSGLEVDLVYVSLHGYNAITRRVVLRNTTPANQDSPSSQSPSFTPSSNSKVILRANSVTMDFESTTAAFHLVQLSGSWARERQIVETKLTHGMLSFGSVRGVSSHQHNPFLGKEFHTPEAVLVRSGDGLGGLSRSFHRLLSDRLIRPTWADETPPVIFNSWEARYFAVSHANVVEMAKQAKAIGVDLLVLDDGWFGSRDDDTTSLGDWFSNDLKFPWGLSAVVKEVNALGLRFGIWFEPEMVSEQSNLYRQHPDWCLDVPGRPRQVGRNQLVLDLSRLEVRDHIFALMHNVLSSANIEYIKWDMNRPLTEVFSKRLDSHTVWQAETSHRYVLGLYDLQHRLLEAFPYILLENCASGGGRFDLGMLYFSPQIWASDNTDAMVRVKVQYGTSLLYPARCIGAHISTVPNHITGNSSRGRTRAFVAMSGTFGYELDLQQISVAEMLIFKELSQVYRTIAPIIRLGDIFRLWNPFKVNFAAWMYVSREKSDAVVMAFSVNSDHWSNLVPRLLLQGLLPEAEYEVCELLPNNLTQSRGSLRIVETEVPMYQLGFPSLVLTGEMLMQAGLPVKFYTLDDSVLFVLKRVYAASVPALHARGRRR